MRRLARALAIGALVMVGSPGCSRSKADMVEDARNDVATLQKLVTLQPVPVEARWSLDPIGKDNGFGPTDRALWAVVRYSAADAATIARALEAAPATPPVTVAAPPAWLLADVDLGRYRGGEDYVFDGAVSNGRPFASSLYSTGFAMTLPDRRVLIHFSSR
ncbi:MAG: hypothetical protein PGN21_15490 [Sphingomonas paucimobilis]